MVVQSVEARSLSLSFKFHRKIIGEGLLVRVFNAWVIHVYVCISLKEKQRVPRVLE
jgi:hypothetical protein